MQTELEVTTVTTQPPQQLHAEMSLDDSEMVAAEKELHDALVAFGEGILELAKEQRL